MDREFSILFLALVLQNQARIAVKQILCLVLLLLVKICTRDNPIQCI